METGYKSLRQKDKKRVRQRTHKRTQRGRKPGSKNIATLQKEALADIARIAANGKLAVEEMDVEIARFDELQRTLYPWDAQGTQLKGKSVQAYYWACEMRRDYLALRAPYQTPRLSAVQVIPAGHGAKRVTEVNVTILNERGEREYTDVPEEDSKLIEHDPDRGVHGEEAA
jgi:hypothetical protein